MSPTRKLYPALVLLSALLVTGCDSAAEFVGGSLLTAGIIFLLAIIFIVVAVLDLVKRPISIVEKLIWAAIIFFVPFIGSVVYWILGRR